MAKATGDRLHGAAVQTFRMLLLVVWAGVSFGVSFFARDLQFTVAGWPVNYWVAAQGAVLVFIAVVVLYAIVMNWIDPDTPDEEEHD